ncbi:MAG: hypothetical protein LBM19_02700 [Holosporales bacterium]|nr:hypothetical protein [Holosporales bacterium]
MFELSIISATILTPLIGGFITLCIDDKNIKNLKAALFWTSLFTLLFASVGLSAFNFPLENECVKELASKSCIGIDAFSFLFAPIIALICFACVLWLLKDKTPKPKIHFAAILFFEAFALGSLYVFNIFLLFILIEATVVPIYVIMSSRESPSNEAIFQFLIYTIAGAFLVLTAIIMICLETKTSNLLEIYKIGVKNKTVFWLLSLGVGIKMPIWPFYRWLPVVHVKSQTVCSVLLASIILKFSSLLIVRFIEPLFLNELSTYQDIITCILLAGMAFALFQLVFQDDLKKFFAYFSIIHLNMYFMILMSGPGKGGFIFSVIGHSVLMAILFFTADIVKRTFNTRLISELKSIATQFPRVQKLTVLFAFLALIAIPFSWNFICEVISVYAVSKISMGYALVAAGIIIISSLAAVYVYCSHFINISGSAGTGKGDVIDEYKKFVMYALFGITLIIGINPNLILRFFLKI